MVRRVVDGDEELTRAFEIESFAPASYEVARDARHCQENGKPEDHLAAAKVGGRTGRTGQRD